MTGLILTDQSIYKTEQCSVFSWWTCVEYTTLYSLEKDDIIELWTTVWWNLIVYWVIFGILWWLLSFVFYIIFPKKWKKRF